MSRRKKIWLYFICSILCLITSLTAQADTGGGAIPKREGTDIEVGVVVDYMGKLRFVILDRDTGAPIPGASIEIYMPGLGRYVLVGLSDGNGCYELDIAYNMNPDWPEGQQFVTIDGKLVLQGNFLYMSGDNQLQYRIYKADWRLYPYSGSVILENKELPQVVTIYLYQKAGGHGGQPVDPAQPAGPGGSGGSDGQNTADASRNALETLLGILSGDIPLGQYLDSGAIPKTGVEGAVPYWTVGVLIFLLAGGILWHLLKKEQDITERERRK